MSYIIVWRAGHRDPFISTDAHDFVETFSTFENAKQHADKVFEMENEENPSPWYFDYQIFEEATS